MKLLDALARWRDHLATRDYDPRQERQEIMQVIARTLAAADYEIRGAQFSVDGPLGGESSKLTVSRILPDGTRQQFIINVYARGVFCPSNEQIRELIDR